MPRIPLVEDLTAASVPEGSNLLVEFDPASVWYNAALTIASGWLKKGGRVGYNAFVRSPDGIRSQFSRLGLNVEALEKADKLRIFDSYTTSLGQKSKEKFAFESLKVADVSIRYAREFMRLPSSPII